MNLSKIQKALEKANKKWPETLTNVPQQDWPGKNHIALGLVRVMRSRDFLVQIYNDRGHTRLSVCRTCIQADGEWQQEITWDELQLLKMQAGYRNKAAVEVYPPDDMVVNVANMRHLWIMDEVPDYVWGK